MSINLGNKLSLKLKHNLVSSTILLFSACELDSDIKEQTSTSEA